MTDPTNSTNASGSSTGDVRLSLDPTATLLQLARIDLRESDLAGVLLRIAELAKGTIPGAAEVSVSLISPGRRGTTPAYTGQMAMAADESQYEGGAGPCVEAAGSGATVRVDDLASEDRWPSYVPGARAAGVRSSLSLPLPIQETLTGALNLYGTVPHAFDDDAAELAHTFAGYAAVAVANAHHYASTAAVARQMEEAMASRAVIEQAKGIIMAERRCGPEEAFQVLITASSRNNRKLREVAAELVATTTRRRD